MIAKARAAKDDESVRLFEGELARLSAPPDDVEIVRQEPEASDTDKFVGHPLTRAALGAASLVTGPFQLGANIGDKITELTGGRPVVGKWMNEKMQQLEAMKLRGMKARGEEGVDIAGLAGSVAGALPLALTRTLASTIPGKIAQGFGTGAAIGASAPVVDDDYWGKKGSQIATDAVVGAAIPGVGPALKAGAQGVAGFGKSAIEPITKEGRKAIEGRFLDMLLDGNRGKVAKALTDAQAPSKYGRPVGEIVGGSKPSVGELVSDIPEAAALAAHQKMLSKDATLRIGEPTIASKFSVREANQAAAQIGSISSIAKTPEMLSKAVNARAKNAQPGYAAVEESTKTVDATGVLDKIGEIIAKHPKETDAVTTPLNTIMKSLFVNGKNMDEGIEKSPLALSSVSKQIKAMIEKTQDNKPQYNAKVLTEIKTLLDDTIGKAEPAYKAVREKFKADSVPVNAMQTGQSLKDSLVNPLDVKTPSSFAAAVSDPQKTIKEATNFGKAKSLEDVFGKRTQVIEAVLSDLKRKQAYDDLAGKANSPVSGGVHATVKGAEGTPGIPRMLSVPATITNYAMRMAGQSADSQINQSIADKYLNPEKLLAAIGGNKGSLPPEKRSKIIEAILSRLNGKSSAIGAIVANQENK